MKRLTAMGVSVLCLNLFSLPGYSQGAAVTTPRVPSPGGSVTQTIGISTVTVTYSRPSIRGRAVWGNLVPYGYNVQAFGAGNPAPWRAGANENTVIKFSHAAMVEGHEVPAGSYGLFFVINKDNTGEVILSKEYKSWGSFFYDQKADLFRAPITVRDVANSTEMLTYDFMHDDKTSAEMVLRWEKKEFPVKISFDVDNIVMANAASELKGVVGFNWQGWFSAANYSLANKVDLDQGIAWIDNAIAQNKSFLTLSTKANILKAQGKTADADKIMDDAVAIATEVELNTYAYNLLNGGQQAKALEMFQLNAKRHPASANCWDSLGEGYAITGDKKNAIANFKKSLSLNPPANVRANSEKYLKQLGAM